MQQKRFISTVLMFIAVLLNANAQQQQETKHEFSLQQCLDYAKKNNTQVKNALLDLKIQEQVNRAYTSSAYPQVKGNLNTTYFPNVTVQSFPNFIAAATYGVLEQEGVKDGNGNPITSPADFGFISAAFGTKWNTAAGISLSQILFDGQVFVGLKARQTALDSKQKSLEVTEESIRVNVYKIYYQLVVSQIQMDLLDANIERARRLQHDAGELYKNGFGEMLDVDRATVQLANLETEKLKNQSIIDNGYLGLKYLIGMPAGDTLILTDRVTDEQIKEKILQDTSYQYHDRKEYQYLELINILNGYNIRRYKAAYMPSANLNSQFSKQAMRNQFNFFNRGDWFTSWYVGFSIDFPIFSGYLRDANVKKAELELKQSQNLLEDLKLSIDEEAGQAKNKFDAAVLTLDNQKTNMSLAQKVYEQAKKKFEVGTGSTTDITNSQLDLRIAQNNYISAMYDAVIAKTDYLKAIGKLP